MFSLTLLLALQATQGLPPSPVARIAIMPVEPTVMVGDSLQLRAEAFDAQGRPVPGVRFMWFPGHSPFEMAIDTSGLLRGGYPGRTVVTAIALVPGARPSTPMAVTVTVAPPPAARIAVSPTVTRLLVGQRVALGAEVFAATGDRRDDPVRWSSSAPEVVEVTADGRLVGRAAGSARVTARAGTASAVLALTVVPNTVRRFEITGGAGAARTGDVLRFRTAARDAGGKELAGLSPVWSLAPGDGQIEQDGTFVPYLPGTYVVTASLGSVSAEATVRVRARDVRREATMDHAHRLVPKRRRQACRGLPRYSRHLQI